MPESPPPRSDTAPGTGHLPFPTYSRAEHLADAVVHLTGIPAAIIASVWLLVRAAQGASAQVVGSLAVYVVGLLGMLGASAAYNMTRPGRVKAVLRRLDHAMIFVMIAGSYTPFALNTLDPALGGILAVLVWGGTIFGVVLKLAFPNRLPRVGMALYLGLGWVMLVAVDELASRLSDAAFLLLVIGGVVYTAGAAVHAARRLPFHNAAWHVLVVVGAGCHFAAVVLEFVPSTA